MKQLLEVMLILCPSYYTQ